jgi:16S rRNA (guanine966-N2)-methyltransferase
MRIIGGSARGRTLKTPVGQDIRPTSDKVRLAIFNALFSRGGVADKTVLDAFCGTGALGCEALSQGAAKSIFCDISKVSLGLTQENVAALGFTDRSEFILKDAAKLPPFIPSPLRGEGQGGGENGGGKIDIVFLDPPYRKGLIIPVLDTLKSGNWLADGAIIVIETEKETPPVEGCGEIVFDKTYGETRVSFLKT